MFSADKPLFLLTLEYKRERSILLLLNKHMCAKDAVFHCDALFADFLGDVFIELFCSHRLFCLAKVGAVATAFSKSACK